MTSDCFLYLKHPLGMNQPKHVSFQEFQVGWTLGFLPYPLPDFWVVSLVARDLDSLPLRRRGTRMESVGFVAPHRGFLQFFCYPWGNCYMTLGYPRYWLNRRDVFYPVKLRVFHKPLQESCHELQWTNLMVCNKVLNIAQIIWIFLPRQKNLSEIH